MADEISKIKVGNTTYRIKDKDLTDLVYNEVVKVTLTASPDLIFVGDVGTIALTATATVTAGSIQISKGGTTIKTAEDVRTTSATNSLTAVAGNNTYTAEFAFASTTKTASASVKGVYPIRIGTGSSYTEGTALNTPKSSPAGTYNVAVANDGDYVFFNVPSDMTINGATMSGFEFPLNTAESKTIGGVSYKSYQSKNTYKAGTITVKLV